MSLGVRSLENDKHEQDPVPSRRLRSSIVVAQTAITLAVVGFQIADSLGFLGGTIAALTVGTVTVVITWLLARTKG